ncbi:kinase-like domain-containing protein [Chaetomium tenue]|uniref:Kinase-like domain-containing protein n=1 Tax=Chaetomium tenue TaxID=1854479 RepID=A0ACB7PBK3_9PEZI|nr:kinase-like domain-containing protein [Chaetomium globosum]
MESPPKTPPSRDPEDEIDFRFETHGTPCEWGESYRPGGYHPVILGDVLRDRYRVVRKLGHGSFSTAWLVADMSLNCFAALKVSVASLGKKEAGTIDKSLAVYRTLPQTANRHVVGLRDSFDVRGPNGRHACLVMDPMGPHISTLLNRPEFKDQTFDPLDPLDPLVRQPRFPKALTHRILRDILLGLRTLHQHGIVHSDLHPGNVLATIPPLGEPLGHDPSVLQKLQQLPSEGHTLVRRDGKIDLWAPSYLLEAAPLEDLVTFELDPVVKLADLGASFLERHPPASVVTPVALRSPEFILRNAQVPLGKGIDIWAFGCLVFELVTGRNLFVGLEGLDGHEASDEGINDEHLIQLSEVLGPLPAELASHWRRRGRYYDTDGKRLEATINHGGAGDESDDGDGMGHDGVNGDDFVDLDDGDDGDDGNDGNDGQAQGEAIPDLPMDDDMSESSDFWLANVGEFLPLEDQLRDLKPEDMDDAEMDEVAGLLRWILEYDASKRPSAEAILAHPWLSSS